MVGPVQELEYIYWSEDLSSFILKVAETSSQIIMKLLKLGYQSILSFGWILKFLGPAKNGGLKGKEKEEKGMGEAKHQTGSTEKNL